MKHVLLGIALLTLSAFAKDMPTAPGSFSIDISRYDFIDTTQNVIKFPKGNASFNAFFNKMDTLVFENRGQVRILHVGGSHLQADVISGRIREHLIKEYPGASAGRGFVFPYSAARTNTPASYASAYKGIWDMNKNVQREIKKPLGLLGIAVSTSDPRSEITLFLDKYNSTPIWGETKLRLFGYSDNNDVVPVLRVDSTDIYGILDSASQSYVFTSPRPIDTIQIAFRWIDSLKQAEISKFITDSLFQDSIARAKEDSIKKATGDTAQKKPIDAAKIPNNVALPEVARDSMFQGECDVLDTACLRREEAKSKSRSCAEKLNKPAVNYAEGEIDATNYANEHCIEQAAVPDSVKKNARPRFTLTGILTETDAPGITYTGVGINGAKVHDYFEEVCPQFEKELSFYKPDLVIFAIGINDANVEKFNDKQFKDDYDKLIARIKKVNPNVAIIFETNNDMYRKVKKKRFVQHPNGDVARKAFFALAEKHKAGVWDKFGIMGGLGSMAKWEKADLAKADKVHFKLSGYNLLGDLFYKAIINCYQEHIANLPAEKRKEEIK
ncbi:GDSL-like Lipase/Acylhydrolase family protein [Fibrobacter sp. UWOV1]|uniref:GDSL-type esterase/lipase family protein n=1 Tax=Fibrobacter sp. UWOV1 TaxID=1896215 RepID=UPI00091CE4F1|nr:GDSL-type esterase/lipase family protein [Fibrobacter sp. UWOV1]SHK31352.1 GDSL-like Lipase/Acylhydrolase family protein [Fibrobacter sp. UWOV1]